MREGLAAVSTGEAYGALSSGTSCPSDEEFGRPPNEAATYDAYARAVACVRRELDAGQAWQLVGTPRR